MGRGTSFAGTTLRPLGASSCACAVQGWGMRTSLSSSPPPSPRAGGSGNGMEPGLRQQPASVIRSTRQSPDLGPAPRRLVQPGMDAPATAPAAAQGEGSPHAQRRAALRVLAELAAIVGDSPGPSAPARQTPPVSPATLPASPVPNRPRLTSVVNLGPRNAAEFASSHISEHLATAPPGARALALADGVESSGAGTWAVDHPHILSYSADYDYREAKETVDLWGVAYTRLRIDHTKPLDAARLDESDKPFSALRPLRVEGQAGQRRGRCRVCRRSVDGIGSQRAAVRGCPSAFRPCAVCPARGNQRWRSAS
jgi:hypothetical protein